MVNGRTQFKIVPELSTIKRMGGGEAPYTGQSCRMSAFRKDSQWTLCSQGSFTGFFNQSQSATLRKCRVRLNAFGPKGKLCNCQNVKEKGKENYLLFCQCYEQWLRRKGSPAKAHEEKACWHLSLSQLRLAPATLEICMETQTLREKQLEIF